MLIYIGCVFPVLSWISLIISMIIHWKTGKNSSPVFVPLIGPILINIWSIQMGHTLWVFVLPWILDIGTIVFLFAVPGFFKEAWDYSKYTKLLSVASKMGNRKVELSMHKKERYIIRYNWDREEGETGILSTNDFGTYEEIDCNNYILTSHTGVIRKLKNTNGEYICKDTESEGEWNLDGCVFT